MPFQFRRQFDETAFAAVRTMIQDLLHDMIDMIRGGAGTAEMPEGSSELLPTFLFLVAVFFDERGFELFLQLFVFSLKSCFFLTEPKNFVDQLVLRLIFQKNARVENITEGCSS